TTCTRSWPRSSRRPPSSRRRTRGAGDGPRVSSNYVSQPDLFVVCKNCGSEVSPYVTECPYCGQRVRKRAPKIERGDSEPKRQRTRRTPGLPKMRRGEIPGIRIDSRPYGTIALIVLTLAVTLVWSTGKVTVRDLGGVYGGLPFLNQW